MKCATLALSAAEDDSALEVARFQKFPPFFNGGLFFAVKDAILGITQGTSHVDSGSDWQHAVGRYHGYPAGEHASRCYLT